MSTQRKISTGPKPKSTETSAPLLPTPSAHTFEENPETWHKRNDKIKIDPKYHGSSGIPLAVRIASISSQAASPANLSPTLDEEKERQTTATSARLCLSASLFTVHDGSSLKMLRDSLLGTTAWFSKQCALTWKKKVTKYNRSLYQLSPSVRHTGEIGSGLLPTTDANDGARGPTKVYDPKAKSQSGRTVVSAVGSGTGLKLQPAFALWMMGFPTDWLDLEDGEMPRSKGRGTQ